MSELVKIQRGAVAAQQSTPGYTAEQVGIVKQTVAKGASDVELAFFLQVCQRTGLDPFTKQVHFIKRWDKRANREVGAIQTGIDGYRAVASRTGQHVGTTDATYDNEDGDHPKWARVTVYRLVGGIRAEYTATARWSEYCQTGRDGQPSGLWGRMPYLMLAKCAESLALRKAFPQELSGVYTFEEMDQADTVEAPRMVPPTPTVTYELKDDPIPLKDGEPADDPAPTEDELSPTDEERARMEYEGMSDEAKYERWATQLSECKDAVDLSRWAAKLSVIEPKGSTVRKMLQEPYKATKAQIGVK